MYLSIMNQDDSYETTAYGIITASLSIIVGLSLYETFRNSKNITFRHWDRVKESISHHLKVLNVVHKHRGIQWKLREDLEALECTVHLLEPSAGKLSDRGDNAE